MRKRKVQTSVDLSSVTKPLRENRIEHKINISSAMWKELIVSDYFMGPGVTVLAKMNSFRPWPALFNSTYKVDNQAKCYVMFYGTFQIGSVSKSQCVPINNCSSYLFHVVAEVKKRFKWKLNYEEIASTKDIERSIKIANLTQVQKLLVALRDIERLHSIPYERSITYSETIQEIAF